MPAKKQTSTAEMANKSTRRGSKPQVERKRRARINNSLDTLQALVVDQERIKVGTRIEKADILEMTVKYITESKKNSENPKLPNLNKLSNDSINSRDGSQSNLSPLDKYNSGYLQCMSNISRFLLEEEIGTDLTNRLTSHLLALLNDFNNRSGPIIKISDEDNVLMESDQSRTIWTDITSSIEFTRDNTAPAIQIYPGRLPNGQVAYMQVHNGISESSADGTFCNCVRDNEYRPISSSSSISTSSSSPLPSSPFYENADAMLKQNDDSMWRPWCRKNVRKISKYH